MVVLAIIIAVFGLMSYNALPRESAPDITIPYIFIMTNYPGVAPEEVPSPKRVRLTAVHKPDHEVTAAQLRLCPRTRARGRKWTRVPERDTIIR